MKNTLIFLLLILPDFYFSQEVNRDSLLNLFEKKLPTEQHAQICIDLYRSYSSEDPKKAAYYLNLAKQEAAQSVNLDLRARVEHATGELQISQGNYKLAIQILETALEKMRKNNQSGQSPLYISLGVAYRDLGQIEKALQAYQSGLIALDSSDYQRRAVLYNNVGNVYLDLAQYTKALQMQFMALKLNEQLNNRKSSASNLHNIGNLLLEQGNYTEAIKYLKKSLEIKESLKPKGKTFSSYSCLGLAFCYLNQYDSALHYLNYADKNALNPHNVANALLNRGLVYDKSGNKREALLTYQKALDGFLTLEIEGIETVACLNNMASIYLENGNHKQVIETASKAMKLAGTGRFTEHELESKRLLAKSYAATGEYKLAYTICGEALTLKDSLANQEIASQMAEMNVKYESEKKEKENLLLEKANERKDLQLKQRMYVIISIGIAAFFVIVVLLLLVREYKMKSLRKTMQLEQKLLRSQMNPHFIFNSLQAIQNFILQKDDKDAVRYLSSFAGIIRSVLENSRMELIPLRKEITLLKAYLELQKLRFGKTFEYVMHVDPDLDQENTLIPPMLSQPFIENALEHGMKDLDNGGLIDILVTLQNDCLLLEIKDNGKGMEAQEGKMNQSLATQITKERIELMNRGNKLKTIFTIDEAYPTELRKGVKVCFTIPMQLLYK